MKFLVMSGCKSAPSVIFTLAALMRWGKRCHNRTPAALRAVRVDRLECLIAAERFDLQLVEPFVFMQHCSHASGPGAIVADQAGSP